MNRQGRILVIDDLENWRKEVVEALQDEGFYADAVSTVDDALERLNETLYHLLILDIRMVDTDPSNKEGIDLLGELEQRGLSEAINVIILLSAYGTQERMRMAFKDYKVVDFLSKEKLNLAILLEPVQRVFSKEVNINLVLQILWQQINGSEQAVTNLEVEGGLVKPGTDLQKRMAFELEDLLCRLFHRAKSILVRPLTQGHSGTGVVRVQPFYATGGSGYEVVVKFGDFHKVQEEYFNFKEYVQPFLGGGRNTMVLDFRCTPHLGGIIYSLLGSINDQLVDFGEFYRRSDESQITKALDRLFHDTCGVWYANRGNLEPLDLTTEYQQLLNYTPEMLEQIVAEQFLSVHGKHRLHLNRLRSNRTFTNPLTMVRKSFVYPTYLCITHGDFNQHNLLVDSTGHVWMIDFQQTGQSHILRDLATLDSVVRFQLLTEEEATLRERLHMEEALCSIKRFSQVKELTTKFLTAKPSLAKAYTIVLHLRTLAQKLVGQNPNDDISEYYIALVYNALNTLRFSSLSSTQREHALLCASLLVDKLGLGD
jgi:CheY-like chemotaxis protein